MNSLHSKRRRLVAGQRLQWSEDSPHVYPFAQVDEMSIFGKYNTLESMLNIKHLSVLGNYARPSTSTMPLVESCQHTSIMGKCTEDDVHVKYLMRGKVVVELAREPAFGGAISTNGQLMRPAETGKVLRGLTKLLRQ